MKKIKCIYYIFLSFFYLQVGDILFFARAAWNKKGDYICSYRALIDLLPMVLIAILWKKYGNKILKILFYSYGVSISL